MKLRRSLALPVIAAALTVSASAGAPDWFRHAAAETLPAYPPDTNAVVLLDEGKTTVKDNGEIVSNGRMAFKILRPQGRNVAEQTFCFRDDTRVTYLKAWSISAQGVEYEVKQKDAIERAAPGYEVYTDARCLHLVIPGGDVGSVVGYEYEQKKRPFILEDSWSFQQYLPVRRSRIVLQLPASWEHRAYWVNHADLAATDLGNNQFAYELTDLPAIEPEPMMPALPVIGAGIGIHYFPPSGNVNGSWQGIGGWEAGLLVGRLQPTPAMQQKVQELTAGLKSPIDKMRALGTYVQREVRYVAIEIGIGGYQPHAASDVFTTRYGDCKDKAALLSTMLRIAGIESNLVLVNTRRGYVTPDRPTTRFDHVIIAIQVPSASSEGLYAVSDVPGVGRVLFFDPTDDLTPFGNLPGVEQDNYSLIVTEKSGVLVKMPIVSSDNNRLERSVALTVGPLGGLTGQVKEVYTGAEAANKRSILRQLDPSERKRSIESFLASFLPSSDVTTFDVKDLDHLDQPLTLTYGFTARQYGKLVGNLLLVRPRVLGEKSQDAFENQNKRERRYPVEFENLLLQSDHVEITLPAGYVADEVPDPVSLDPGPVSYVSKVALKDNVIHYDREYRIKDIYVGTDKLQELKKFYRQLAGEEQNAVVLKKQ
jgi:hypothetical protein